MVGIRNKTPPADGEAQRKALLQALRAGDIKVTSEAPGKPDLRTRVRVHEGNLNAQAERLASALRDIRHELSDRHGADTGEKQYQALVKGLTPPPVRRAVKADTVPHAPPVPLTPPAESAARPAGAKVKRTGSGRLLQALTLRGALKRVVHKSLPPKAQVAAKPIVIAKDVAEPAPLADPLLQVGDALRAKVRVQVAQALDDPTPDGLREALQGVLLFDPPVSPRACELRHRLVEAEMLADPVHPDTLYTAVADFVRHNPPVSGFDYAIFENAPVLYTAFAGHKDRTRTVATFLAQICEAQYSEDEFLPGDPKLEAVDKLCETNEACLAYFAEGKRSVRLIVLSAAGLTRQLMRNAEKLSAEYKARNSP